MNDEPVTSPTPGTPRRTIVLASVAAAGAAFLGYYLGAQRDVDTFPDETAAAARVETPVPVASPTPPRVEETIRGVINAASESTVASRMTARIIAMPYSEGQAFRAGATLVEFDCSSTAAQLRAAQAATAAYRETYRTQVELDEFEATGKNDVAISRANLGKAEAEAKAVAAQMSDCSVRAPFSGKVVEQMARRNDIAASGQPLLKIQSGGNVELELIVPSKWLTWLGPGAEFAFKIDETGNTIRGKVQRLGAAVDPVSKTIKVVGIMTESEGLILAGMSGTATFDDPRATGRPAPAPTDRAVDKLRKPVANDSANPG